MTPIKLISICCLIILMFSSQAFSYDNRPIIVMREDDIWLSSRDVFPEFENKSLLEFGKKLKIPITWGVITDRASNGTGLSWAELIDYVTNAGGELASHSATHVPMSSLQAYVNDVLQSKAAIQANTPYTCNTFLQPGTWTGDAYFNSSDKMNNILGQAIQNNFRQSQLYFLGSSGIGSLVYKHGYSANCDIDYIYQPVPTDFLKAIDYISQIPGYIYVIQFHGIQSPTGTEGWKTRSDLMAALLIKLDQLRNDGKIRLLSINDAYNNNQFSPDISRVFDQGFEYTAPELAKYCNGWKVSGGTTIVDQVGYNNSKCCRMIQGGKLEQVVFIPSGKYKLTWIQRPDSGTTLDDKGVTPMVFAVNSNNAQFNVINFPSYKNESDIWEEKSIILKIPDKANRVYMRLYWLYPGAFLADNVSMKQITTDPYECVSGFKVTPSPSGLQLNWRAPDNTQYKYIYLKYNLTQRCPQTPDEGTSVQVVAADNGKEQSFFCPFNWTGKGSVFFSAFAVKQDNTYSEPDVDFLQADQTKPVVTNLATTVDPYKRINATWLAKANASEIYTTMYSVGNSPSSPDVIGWTANDNGAVTFGPLNGGVKYYLNVKTENVFGVWSDIVYVPVTVGPSGFLSNPDGTSLSLTGTVSAVFNGLYYIQFQDILRGIKVVDPTASLSLGMNVTVQGILKTNAGERYIDVQNPQ